MRAFGPVPSRRLGRSLGINNIQLKVCTYSCVYCQLGRTKKLQIDRRPFYSPKTLFEAVERKVKKSMETGQSIDYLTFVSDGEPTLDICIDQEIDMMRRLGIKIAVITNGSLLWLNEVREQLAGADWVSLKIDSIQEDTWRKINRPHGVLKGMLHFADEYCGQLATETMLVEGLNDGEDGIIKLAEFLADLNPDTAYLSVPTRPPAESWVRPPATEMLNRAYMVLSDRLLNVDTITGYEGNDFSTTGNVEEDLLSITAVHPMKEEAVVELLEKADSDWNVIEKMLAQNILAKTRYRGSTFYMRK